MSGVLLDTNVLSELIRKRPEKRVVDRALALDPRDRWTSAICLMELRAGAERHPRGTAIWERIAAEVLPLVRVAPVDEGTALLAGRIVAKLALAGTPIGVEDVLIGATAIHRRFRIATRNVKHLGRIDDLDVDDWWRPEP